MSGAEGIRTPDPLTASQVLCQAELQPQEWEPPGKRGFMSVTRLRLRRLCHLSAIYRALPGSIIDASSSTASRCIPGSTEL